jgi:hypothetical protein
MLEVPHKLRVGRYLEYKMLLESPELAKIQYNRTGVPVFMHARLKLTGNENALMKISKNGHTNIFSPDGIDHIDYAKALRESHRLVSFFEKVLFDKRTLGRGYFNQKFIKKMFYDHVAGKGDYHRILFAVITFEILLRTFFDKDAVKPSDNILKEH